MRHLNALVPAQVSPDASADELKRAFRKRALESHPDLAKSTANSRRHLFGAVLNAYKVCRLAHHQWLSPGPSQQCLTAPSCPKVLSNPQQRELYDVTRTDIANNTWRSAAAAGVHG